MQEIGKGQVDPNKHPKKLQRFVSGCTGGVICGHDNVHRQYWCWWYRLVGCIVVLSVDVAMYTVAKKYIIVLDGGEN